MMRPIKAAGGQGLILIYSYILTCLWYWYLVLFCTNHLVRIRSIATQQIRIIHLHLGPEMKMRPDGVGVDQQR